MTPRTIALLASLSLALAPSAHAEVRLPPVISPHMVLQQQSDVAIWGWAAPGEQVTVKFSADPAWQGQALTPASGRWRVNLKTPGAGGPYTLEVRGSNTIRVDDVLVGEVWLCGGQSNMEWAFAYGGVLDAEKERAAANDPQVRLFDVPNVVAAKPADDCRAAWAACTPETVNGFSCVGWFFARELRRELGAVPIGLIGVNWGGTVAQAWVSREALAPFQRFAGELAWVAQEAEHPEDTEARLARAMAGWWAALDTKDLGARNGWAKRDFDDSGWESATLPGLWSGAMQGVDGVVWYRRTIELPKELAGRELELALGPIDDMDQVWLDGAKVAGTEVHGHWTEARHYKLPASAAAPGRHLLALRVVDTGGDGGLSGSPGDLAITSAGTAARVELAGEWKLRLGMDAGDFPRMPDQGQRLHANVATVLWNGMVAPIVPFGIRGALWYQGESNRGYAAEYADLMPALIAEWRGRFERPDFPFLFVQIAPFNYGGPPGVTAELRQAQLETLRVKNSGMAVTTDIGDAANIHPANKQEVGRRLALWALAQTYGKDVGEVSGPLFESQAVEGRAIRVRFTHTTGGLVARGGEGGGELTGFEIRGADGAWHAAKATIDAKDPTTILVSSDAVPAPQEARFGCADVCANNLFNGAGLPASPFCRIAR